jgi:hypothetical protein
MPQLGRRLPNHPCFNVRYIDNAMVKAISRAFLWREMLENGTHATIAEIAAVEKINQSYVCRILRLTLLAPDIVEAILAAMLVGLRLAIGDFLESQRI